MQALLARIGLGRRELVAWAMYDWANSAFWTTVIVAVFPPFFSEYAASGLSPLDATSRYAWGTTIAVTIVAIIAPVLGTIADQRAMKKPLLGVFLVIGVVATLMMATIEGGQWRYALVLFIIANVGVAATLVFYDSLLPHIAASDEFDRVSTAGYAIGFIGGGVLLLINLAWILSPGTFGLSGTVAAIKLSLASVGVWWLLFSIPLFRVVREPVVRSAAAATPLRLGATIRTTWDTFQELRRHRNALWMLVAFLLYNDGIQTIIRMSSIYGAEIGIDRNAQIMAFVMVQFVGVPCSFLFGSIAGRIGPKTALSFTLAVYMGISILGYFLMTAWQFFALAFLVGTVQGPSQALSRSLYARMIPKEKSSECFGFFAVFEKFAGIAGPAVFAGSITLFQSSRAAVLSVLVFFVLGAIALTRVDVAAGESQVAGGSVL